MLPWLKENSEVFDVFHTRFHILQVASSWVGGIVVIAALISIPADKSLTEHKSIFKYWLIAAIITAAVFGLRVLSGLNLHLAGDTAISCISAGLIALVLTPQVL